MSLLTPIPDWGLALIALAIYLGIAYPAARAYFRIVMDDDDRDRMSKSDLKDALDTSIAFGLFWPIGVPVTLFVLGFAGLGSILRNQIAKTETRSEKAHRLEREHREALRAAAAQATQDQQEKAALQRRIDLLERLNQVGPYALDGGKS